MEKRDLCCCVVEKAGTRKAGSVISRVDEVVSERACVRPRDERAQCNEVAMCILNNAVNAWDLGFLGIYVEFKVRH